MPNEVKNWVIVCGWCKRVHRFSSTYKPSGICICNSEHVDVYPEEEYQKIKREEKLKRILDID